MIKSEVGMRDQILLQQPHPLCLFIKEHERVDWRIKLLNQNLIIPCWYVEVIFKLVQNHCKIFPLLKLRVRHCSQLSDLVRPRHD